MNIVVAIKHIPSMKDELPVNKAGSNVDFDSVDFVLNEFDEQAIEQAVLVKESTGGTVTVIGVDLIEELDGILHTALAKGADKAVKIAASDDPGADSHMQARWLAEAIKDMSPDVVFAGVQAANDLDGQVGPMLAAFLDMPYIGGVSSVDASGEGVIISKEYPGGVVGKYEVSLPAVVGIQAAAKPPRYAPISKIRQIAQSVEIEELDPSGEAHAGLSLQQMAAPVSAGHAEMFDGSAKEVAAKIVELLKSKGLA